MTFETLEPGETTTFSLNLSITPEDTQDIVIEFVSSENAYEELIHKLSVSDSNDGGEKTVESSSSGGGGGFVPMNFRRYSYETYDLYNELRYLSELHDLTGFDPDYEQFSESDIYQATQEMKDCISAVRWFDNGTIYTEFNSSCTERYINFTIYDIIIKNVANTASDIDIALSQGSMSVIEDDPKILFTYDHLFVNDSRSFTYRFLNGTNQIKNLQRPIIFCWPVPLNYSEPLNEENDTNESIIEPIVNTTNQTQPHKESKDEDKIPTRHTLDFKAVYKSYYAFMVRNTNQIILIFAAIGLVVLIVIAILRRWYRALFQFFYTFRFFRDVYHTIVHRSIDIYQEIEYRYLKIRFAIASFAENVYLLFMPQMKGQSTSYHIKDPLLRSEMDTYFLLKEVEHDINDDRYDRIEERIDQLKILLDDLNRRSTSGSTIQHDYIIMNQMFTILKTRVDMHNEQLLIQKKEHLIAQIEKKMKLYDEWVAHRERKSYETAMELKKKLGKYDRAKLGRLLDYQTKELRELRRRNDMKGKVLTNAIQSINKRIDRERIVNEKLETEAKSNNTDTEVVGDSMFHKILYKQFFSSKKKILKMTDLEATLYFKLQQLLFFINNDEEQERIESTFKEAEAVKDQIDMNLKDSIKNKEITEFYLHYLKPKYIQIQRKVKKTERYLTQEPKRV